MYAKRQRRELRRFAKALSRMGEQQRRLLLAMTTRMARLSRAEIAPRSGEALASALSWLHSWLHFGAEIVPFLMEKLGSMLVSGLFSVAGENPPLSAMSTKIFQYYWKILNHQELSCFRFLP